MRIDPILFSEPDDGPLAVRFVVYGDDDEYVGDFIVSYDAQDRSFGESDQFRALGMGSVRGVGGEYVDGCVPDRILDAAAAAVTEQTGYDVRHRQFKVDE